MGGVGGWGGGGGGGVCNWSVVHCGTTTLVSNGHVLKLRGALFLGAPTVQDYAYCIYSTVH